MNQWVEYQESQQGSSGEKTDMGQRELWSPHKCHKLLSVFAYFSLCGSCEIYET